MPEPQGSYTLPANYVQVPVSIDLEALHAATTYARDNYGRAIHVTGITHFPDGSCRIHFDSYTETADYPTGIRDVSVWGRGNGDAGE